MPLPSGTVVFLFTDIEGSTRRWETDEQAMAAAVERHLAILREAIEARGGVLYKTVGDATQSVFTSASAALGAAVAAQRALQTEAWPEVITPLSVRMAVHVGEAEPRDGDYVAAPLNRLARLLAVTGGGQILLTQAVQQLVRDDLPAGADLRDLGEHHLRDLDHSDRVFQYLHPDLPGGSSPSLSSDLQRRHLPAAYTPLLGRESEQERIVTYLKDHTTRLLTLTGPGGVGKTRLALAAAERVRNEFSDGVAFVDLASLRDPQLVPAAIAASLGIREGAGRPVSEVVREYLHSRRLLLVLDNFEHVLGASPFIHDLLDAPALKILVTSRQRLALVAEQEMPISPLSVPDPEHLPPLAQLARFDAVRLFVSRAQRLKPDFAITDENAATIAAICHRLDGLPLAIELAAVRIRVLSPAALLARLETSLPVLTGGARDLPARQQTMHDAIAWSFDLLDPGEQALLRRLGVFAGGWSLAAMEAVTKQNSSGDSLDLLASLVDQSLVQLEERPAEPRYRLLEVVREFALEQLKNSREEPATREAHACWYLLLVQRLRREFVLGRVAPIHAISQDRDNLRQALTWFLTRHDVRALELATSLGDVWWFRGDFSEGRHWLTQVLNQVATDTPPPLHSSALFYAAGMTMMQGDVIEANRLATRALATAQTAGDVPGIAKASFMLGYASLLENDADQGITWAEQAASLTRSGDDDAWLPWMLILLGEALARKGDVARSQQNLEEALALFEQWQSEWGQGHALYRLAVLAGSRGDLPRAAELYERALRLRFASDDRWGFIEALIGIARIGSRTNQPQATARLLGAADAFGAEIGYTRVGTAHIQFEQTLNSVRDQLAAESVDQALAAGHTISRQQAIEEVTAVIETARADRGGRVMG